MTGDSGCAVTHLICFLSSYILYGKDPSSVTSTPDEDKVSNLCAIGEEQNNAFIATYKTKLLKFISICVLIVTHKLSCF